MSGIRGFIQRHWRPLGYAYDWRCGCKADAVRLQGRCSAVRGATRYDQLLVDDLRIASGNKSKLCRWRIIWRRFRLEEGGLKTVIFGKGRHTFSFIMENRGDECRETHFLLNAIMSEVGRRKYKNGYQSGKFDLNDSPIICSPFNDRAFFPISDWLQISLVFSPLSFPFSRSTFVFKTKRGSI